MTLNGTLFVLMSIIILSITHNVSGYNFDEELEEEKHEGDGPYRPQFLLYTREPRDAPHLLTIDQIDSIQKSPLKKDGKLYFIIHGYFSSGDNNWVQDMKQELLIREDCNVVTVDWRYGAAWIHYGRSVFITTSVGARTARLAAQLIVYGKISPSKIHVIGHSLGAHTAGDVGHFLRGRYGYTLSRITGLDPAGPLFTDTIPLHRLDPNDAAFVSVIHTDIAFLGFGIAHPVGQIDFYPNGGRDQLSCEKGGLTCDHSQSQQFFIDSINTKCPFWAVPCESWEEFLKGNCFDCANQKCRKFGFDVQPKKSDSNESYYLLTGSDSHSCRATYRIKIHFPPALSDDYEKSEKGQFVINIIGVDSNMTEPLELSEKSQYYEPGSTHTVVLSGQSVGKMESVLLLWKKKNNFFQKIISKNEFGKSSISVESVTVDILKPDDKSITVCLPRPRVLFENQAKILTVENCK